MDHSTLGLRVKKKKTKRGKDDGLSPLLFLRHSFNMYTGYTIDIHVIYMVYNIYTGYTMNIHDIPYIYNIYTGYTINIHDIQYIYTIYVYRVHG